MLIFNQLTESFKFAIHALRNNNLRTFLSLLGITIGIFAIILVYSVVDSLEKNIRDSVESLGDNIVYIQKWPFGGGGEYAWWKYLNRPEPIPSDAESLIKRTKSAESIVFVYSTNTSATYRNNNADGVDLIGATYPFADLWNFTLSDGRYFTENESQSGKPYCIIGTDIAEALFNDQNPLGKRIKAKGRKLTIIGVFEKTGSSLVGQNYDEMVLVPASFLRKILNPKNTSGNSIMAKAKPGIATEQMKDELRGNLRALHRLKPKVADDFSLNEISMISASLDSLFSVLGIAGTFIGGFSILVGGFGIANIMFVSVRERTTEIGIQKALGAKKNFILIQFLTESILLCIMGGIIGLGLVYLVTTIISSVIEFHIYLSASNTILGVSLSVIIGLISGFIPAYLAANMNPVDAIRSRQ